MILSVVAMCMALNLYYEARSHGIQEQVNVGQVVLNRVASDDFPDDVCLVIYERNQFSWYWDGLSDEPYEIAAWELAQGLAVALVNGWFWVDATGGATFYHVDKQWNESEKRWVPFRPYLANRLVHTVTDEAHRFYLQEN